jgi:spermidine synthase
VVFEATSPYHHMRVTDERGLRSLSFDGFVQSRMSLRDPWQGHFEYVEYFHLAWLWNLRMTNALMVGLGGGSIQRLFQRYYPEVTVDTVEIDPVVQKVARDYFGYQESPSHRVHPADGRVFLRRSQKKYDLIVLDAYTRNRYGCVAPPHLVTKEFFELAKEHLSEAGVLAYNVIGTWQGPAARMPGAVYRTLQAVFPQVYSFPAQESQNIVFLAVRQPEKFSPQMVQGRAAELARNRLVVPPTLETRARACRFEAPPGVLAAPVLTDDRAPVEGLANAGPARAAGSPPAQPSQSR